MSASHDSSVRGGLGRFGAKLRQGGPVTVAYLGGSITWGGHASDIERFSYRARTTAWLRERYPAAAITAINAGIGGTGSNLGAFRLRQDVLRHRPDLVFIEFCVNDGGGSDEVILSAFEGIVRAIRRDLAEADICIVYTLNKNHLPAYDEGKLPHTVDLHERVADRYGVASIHMGRAVARSLQRGELTWDVFSKDVCHPSDEGFALFTQTIVTALPVMFEAPPRDTSAPMPAPLSADPLDTADMRPVVPADAGDGWTYRPMEARGGWDCFTGLVESDTPGATLNVSFTGRQIGVLFQLGPDSGDMDVAIDGGPFERLRVFDNWSVNIARPQHRILPAKLAPGPHTLRLKVAGTRDDRATGCFVRLGYIMTR